MAEEFFSLTRDDLAVVKQLVARERSRQNRTTGRPYVEQQDYMAPEVYIARTPAGGIAALSLGLITGTGSSEAITDDDVPGTADCFLYQLLNQGTPQLLPMGKDLERVYNLSTNSIPQYTWITVVRDKWGSWIAQAVMGTTAGITPSPSTSLQTFVLLKKGDAVSNSCLYEARIMSFSFSHGPTITGTEPNPDLCCWYEVADAYLTLLDPVGDVRNYYWGAYSDEHPDDGLPIYGSVRGVPDPDICVHDPCCPDDILSSSLCVTIANCACPCFNGRYFLPYVPSEDDAAFSQWTVSVSYNCTLSEIESDCIIRLAVFCMPSSYPSTLPRPRYILTINVDYVDDSDGELGGYIYAFHSDCPTVRSTATNVQLPNNRPIGAGTLSLCCGGPPVGGTLNPLVLDISIDDSPCPAIPIDPGPGTGIPDCLSYPAYPNCCPDTCIPADLTVTVVSDCPGMAGTFPIPFTLDDPEDPHSSGAWESGPPHNFFFGCAGSSLTFAGSDADGNPFPQSIASSVICDPFAVSGSGTCPGGGTFTWSLGATPPPPPSTVPCCPDPVPETLYCHVTATGTCSALNGVAFAVTSGGTDTWSGSTGTAPCDLAVTLSCASGSVCDDFVITATLNGTPGTPTENTCNCSAFALSTKTFSIDGTDLSFNFSETP